MLFVQDSDLDEIVGVGELGQGNISEIPNPARDQTKVNQLPESIHDAEEDGTAAEDIAEDDDEEEEEEFYSRVFEPEAAVPNQGSTSRSILRQRSRKRQRRKVPRHVMLDVDSRDIRRREGGSDYNNTRGGGTVTASRHSSGGNGGAAGGLNQSDIESDGTHSRGGMNSDGRFSRGGNVSDGRLNNRGRNGGHSGGGISQHRGGTSSQSRPPPETFEWIPGEESEENDQVQLLKKMVYKLSLELRCAPVFTSYNFDLYTILEIITIHAFLLHFLQQGAGSQT
jgi:hypothetical protein